jgi:hypothetical protein
MDAHSRRRSPRQRHHAVWGGGRRISNVRSRAEGDAAGGAGSGHVDLPGVPHGRVLLSRPRPVDGSTCFARILDGTVPAFPTKAEVLMLLILPANGRDGRSRRRAVLLAPPRAHRPLRTSERPADRHRAVQRRTGVAAPDAAGRLSCVW